MTPLRLRAVDPIDLSVVAAHLQDAIARVGDMAFEPGKRRFAVMLNRFIWEDLDAAAKGARPDKKVPYRRVRSALHFDAVRRVQHQGLKLGTKDKLAELLTLSFEAGAEPSGTVKMTFAGGATVKLDVECLDAWLTDISAPWPTKNRPGHGEEAGA
jgi:Protein of unknown function (DUF2948)